MDIVTAFEELIHCDDADIDLARCALTFAQHRHANLDVPRFLARLDGFAESVTALSPSNTNEWLEALSSVLFVQGGFRGNTGDYYNPSNSYLNEVLDSRLGIPITLSLVYLETAWRAGCTVAPVSFPGHFVVRLEGDDSAPVFVDPFHGGHRVDKAGLRAQLQQIAGEAAANSVPMEAAVTAVSKREVLARMFRNLLGIYTSTEALEDALQIADFAVRLIPDGALERRTRGLLYWQVGHATAAMADLVAYRRLVPNADDASQIDQLLTEMNRDASHLN